MNFEEANRYLLSLGNEVAAMKLGLKNIRILLDALGEPQKNYLKVQVAGTNGKGSVCAFLDSICLAAGIKTGVFTSPHLISITERIRINGTDISDSDLARYATHVREMAESLLENGKLQYRPTFFEQVTAIALIAFREAGIELAVLETGLGGRLDATTAANAEIAVITRIDLDHQEYLGESIEEIAAEKAAIIRRDSIVCIGKQTAEAMSVIVDRCEEEGIEYASLSNAKWVRNFEGYDLRVEDFVIGKIVLGLEGAHQAENAALAILAALRLGKFFQVTHENIAAGLERAVHRGRLECVDLDGIRVLFDGAHNLGGALVLREYLRHRCADHSIALVYGSMRDKDHSAILGILAPMATDIILTEAPNVRSASSLEMADEVKELGFRENVFSIPSVAQAFHSSLQFAQNYPSTKPSMVLVTGSLYLVGEVKKILLENKTSN